MDKIQLGLWLFGGAVIAIIVFAVWWNDEIRR